MADDVIIRVENVYKNFNLPHEKNTTVKSMFTGLFSAGLGARRSIETQHALRDISFEVKRGEFFGIVGRNGSGKSTLLKILAGIYQPTKGRVSVGGKLVPFIELGVGFNPELTGRENVYLNGSLLGFSRQEIDEMYEEIVSFAELERFMDQKLKNYSSGMQVRLAFAMAIRADAEILLVDEVLAVGDADFQRKCFDYFKKLKRNKKTVVFVSHDMTAVREYCDKAILIEKSELSLSGSANKIANAYTKMFIDAVENKESQESNNKWGDGMIVMSDIRVSSATLKDKDSTLTIELKATAKANIQNPIFGFSITDPSGSRILGTNTQIEKHLITDMGKGSSLNIKWEIPNIFNEGRHYINLAAVYENGSRTGEWWDEARVFRVVKGKRTPYTVSPILGLSISKVNP